MLRIAIVNQHTNNYGDDAAGCALINEAVEHLGAGAVDVFYIWHKNGGRLPVGSAAVRHHHTDILSGTRDTRAHLALAVVLQALLKRTGVRSLDQMVQTCRQADYVFVSPAGANIGIYKDWMYLFVLLVLVLAGVKPIFHQNTIGPSNSRAFNRVALFALRRSRIYVRESHSHEWLKRHRIDSHLGVDSAFLLRTPTGCLTPKKVARPYIAVVPTRLANWHRDFASFSDSRFTQDVLARGLAAVNRFELDIVIVPHLYGPESERVQNLELVEHLRRLGFHARVADVSSYLHYLDVLTGASAAVSMRYHGLILATIGGTPCVSLSYESKVKEASAYLGLSDLTLETTTATADAIASRVQAALDFPETRHREVAERITALRKIASAPLLELNSRHVRDYTHPRLS